MAQTVVELFEERVHRSSVRCALRRFHDGIWEEMTWKEWWDASERVAAGLMERGLEPGQRVCVLVSTRLEWAIVDMGLAMAGLVCMPLHSATSPQHLAKVLQENDVPCVVVENPLQLGKVVEIFEETPDLEQVVYLDEDVLIESKGRGGGDFLRLRTLEIPSRLKVISLDEIATQGRAALAEDSRFVAGRRRSIDADREATILYTAGVSDHPRGVVLTHRNLVAQIEALSALQLFSNEDVQLLFLPMAHIFSRILYLAGVGYGMTTVFGRGPEWLVDDLAEVQPTLLASVPRVYERIQEEILRRIHRRGLRAKLLPLALEVGKAVSRRTQGGDRVGMFLRWEHSLFSRLLLEDVQQWLGGRMRFLISGGAPLDKKTADFFFSAGILLLEGYGMTETSGAVTFNMPDDFRLGSVGKPLPGVDVTIAEDGEVLVRGNTIARGYVDGAARDDAGNGWFNTGDIGNFDHQGFLYLTDRKRDLIVTSTGKHILAGPLERELCDHDLIAHALVLGEGRPFLGAILALDPDALLAFVDENDIDGDWSIRDLTENRLLHQALQAHIEEVNRRRSSYEHIQQFAVVPEFLSTQTQTLSASGTLRRLEVLARHEELVEKLFEAKSTRNLSGKAGRGVF